MPFVKFDASKKDANVLLATDARGADRFDSGGFGLS